MAGNNDANAPFIQFLDAANLERRHDYRTTAFCCEMAFVYIRLRRKILLSMLFWSSLVDLAD